jgi:hypothetical protein
MIRKATIFAVVGLAMLVLGVAAASAGPMATGQAGVKAAVTTENGVRVSQLTCPMRCHNIVMRRRCRPGSVCQFKSHAYCRCVRRPRGCALRCRSRLITRRCNMRGWCKVMVRFCRCLGPRPGPMPPR